MTTPAKKTAPGPGFQGGAIPPRSDRTTVECSSGCDHDWTHGLCRSHGEPIRHRIDEPPTCDCPPRRPHVAEAADRLAALSRWIDESPANAGRDREALGWHRVAKVSEEAGEAVSAWLGYTGGNPRKGVTHELGDVIGELLDTATAALAGVEHLTGNQGHSMWMLLEKINTVHKRSKENS